MLEQFVNNHRGEFDSEEPTTGHELRFAKKMQSATVKRRWLYYASAAAAVALLLVGVSIFHHQPEECPISEEMREVQQYYGGLLMLEQNKLNKILACTDEETRAEVLSDVEQLLNESAISASSLCYDNPAVVAALVTEYHSKIEQLQQLELMLQSSNPCNEG